MATPILIQIPSDINKVVEEIGNSIFGFTPRTGCHMHTHRCGSGFPFAAPSTRGSFRCRPGFSNCRANTWSGNFSEAEAKCSKANKTEAKGECRRDCRCQCKPKDATGNSSDLTTSSKEGGLNVSLDVRNYTPSELSVKVVDNFVVIEGNAEEKEADGGFVSRNFVRKFVVPENCDKDNVMSSLSPDGTLTINIPARKENVHKPEERVVHIQQIGSTEVTPETIENEEAVTAEAEN